MNPRYDQLNKNINHLQTMMLTSELLIKSQQYIKSKPMPMICVKPEKEKILYPSYVDKLYWCFYIITNGLDSYEQIGQNIFSIETKDKIDLVSKIREGKDRIKMFKKKIVESEGDLVSSPFISFDTFEILCILKGLNVIILKNKTYYHMNYGDDKTYIIHMKDKRYGIELNTTNEIIEGYKKTHMKISSLVKPLNSVSSYKLDELRDMCNKLNIEVMCKNGKSKTKSVLYQNLLEII